MGAATDERPKAHLEVAGRTLLDWQRTAFSELGIASERLALVRGYRSATLVHDGPTFENPDWQTTGIVASLSRATPWLEADTTLVSYADLIYREDALRALAAAEGDLCILYDRNWRALWERRFAAPGEDPSSDAETFRIADDGRLLAIGARPQSLDEVQGQYMGLIKLSPKGARAFLGLRADLDAGRRRTIDMTSLLSFGLTHGFPGSLHVRAVPFEGRWCELDRPSDVLVAEELFALAPGDHLG